MNSRRAFEHFNSEKPGGYELLDNGRLGGGGQAEVFAGSKKGSEHSYAIKLMVPDRDDGIDVTLFKDEANIMHELGNHPNIATVHFSGDFTARTKQEKENGVAPTHYLYTVMDKALGTLADEISLAGGTQLGRLPATVATQYILDIVAGVGHAHGEQFSGSSKRGGVLHRDIKPANALLFPPRNSSQPPQLQLADFGISRRGYASASAITQTHLGAGTWLYADPRQFYPGGALYAHDQYMAATTGWHTLTGRPLFEEFSSDLLQLQNAHLYRDREVRQLMTSEGKVDKVAEAVQYALLRALDQDPGARYESMGEMGDAILEAAMRAGEQQVRERTIHPFGELLEWQLPATDEEYVVSFRKRHNLDPSDPIVQRRDFLAWGGVSALAIAGVGAAFWYEGRRSDAKKENKATKTPKEALEDAFASKPPKLPEYSDAEKVAVRQSISAVNKIVTKWLKQEAQNAGGDQHGLESLVTALASYDADGAYDLWSWLASQGSLSNDLGGKAETHAWAAASLATVKPDQMAQILQSKAWADGGLTSDGSYTETDTIRACNRGVLGCALADVRPASVTSVVDTYSGSDPIANGFDPALTFCLSPKQGDAERAFDLLGLEHSAAAAASLARQNPNLLTKHMANNRSDWALSVRNFGRALIPLLATRPHFVATIIADKVLDQKITPFEESATLEVTLLAAAKNPEITEDILRQRLADAPKVAQSMLAISLAGYKPDIAKALAMELKDDSLLALALDPTNPTLRNQAVGDINAALSRDAASLADNNTTLGHAALLAIAFMRGQQRRLGE